MKDRLSGAQEDQLHDAWDTMITTIAEGMGLTASQAETALAVLAAKMKNLQAKDLLLDTTSEQ